METLEEALIRKYGAATKGWVPVDIIGVSEPRLCWHMLTFATKQVDFWINDCDFNVVPVFVGTPLIEVPTVQQPSHVILPLAEVVLMFQLLESAKACVSEQLAHSIGTLLAQLKQPPKMENSQ